MVWNAGWKSVFEYWLRTVASRRVLNVFLHDQLDASEGSYENLRCLNSFVCTYRRLRSYVNISYNSIKVKLTWILAISSFILLRLKYLSRLSIPIFHCPLQTFSSIQVALPPAESFLPLLFFFALRALIMHVEVIPEPILEIYASMVLTGRCGNSNHKLIG